MDLLSLGLGFLCPKLSTQGVIKCSPKLQLPWISQIILNKAMDGTLEA